MAQLVERPLCKRKVAGANPAESIKLLEKKFYQEAEGKSSENSASLSAFESPSRLNNKY